jgi:CO/xanthine dehydrogenase Mo-binding subunit/aerobic-type carbon monoxide dehydrogenase small subunit (CoxS/CutS family)
MRKRPIRLFVNGVERQLEVDSTRPLIDVLREGLDLTGTKRGCDNGECASCTVLLDGVSVPSCQLAVGAVAGRTVETIEGLGWPEELHPLQEAFVQKGAVQCGFCTPGMIVETEALLRTNPSPTREQFKERLGHHLCRCTGYVKVLEAAEYGAHLRGGGAREPETNGSGYVGRRVPARDSVAKATGRMRYSADLSRPGMLWAKVLYSPHAHAVIRSIDTSAARQMPGVAAIVTGKDLPLGADSTMRPDGKQPILAVDRTFWIGEPLAAVAAETQEEAEKAVAAIRVDYDVLEPVLTIEEAMAEGAPQLDPDGNLILDQKVVYGDVEGGFAQADAIVENWYYCGYQEHGYLEPEAGLAYLDEDGRLVVEAGTQYPYHCWHALARWLELDHDQVRFISPPTGGSFGGKHVDHPYMLAALLAYQAKRPVKIVCSRAESLLTTAKRHPALMRFKTGATSDGKIVAMEGDLYHNVGGYQGGAMVAKYSAITAPGPYEVPNVRINSYYVATNVQKQGSFRGVGSIKVCFAHEQQMDLLAEKLGLDPWEIRRRNALQVGCITCSGHQLEEGVGVIQGLEAVRPYYDEAVARARRENETRGTSSPWRRGVGLGLGWRAPGGQTKDLTEGTVELLPDGTLEVRSGMMELGTGATTGVAQIAAELLGVKLEDVNMIGGDSLEAPFPFTTSGEKGITLVGSAVYRAANELRASLAQVASEFLGEPPELVRFESGRVSSPSDPEGGLPLARLATLASQAGVELKHKGGHRWPGYTPLDPETGRGVLADFYAFQSQLAEVDVNTATGEVQVLRIVAAADAGRVINPLALEGQMQGALLQGMGYALTEEFVPAKTSALREYGLPTIHDVPEMVLLIVGDEISFGPFGAKGAGETPVVPPPAAIANAIANATGARLYSLPMKPEKVLAALRGEREQVGAELLPA